jgi:5-methylcytosine-specific restriction endonuclease McrA
MPLSIQNNPSTSSDLYDKATSATVSYSTTAPLNKSSQFKNYCAYVCEYKHCDKKFRYKSLYERHMKTHIGEKSFTCPDCNRVFMRKGNLTRHIIAEHKVIGSSTINPSSEITSEDCNNAKDKIIDDCYQDIQDICKNRKIKFCTTSIKQMIFALRHNNNERLQTTESLKRFTDQIILFLRYMNLGKKSSNSTTVITNMLLNKQAKFYSNVSVMLDLTDEQLMEIARFEYIQDISTIYHQHAMVTHECFMLYHNFLYQNNETESNIKIQSQAAAIILEYRGVSSESLNKLSTFFAFPVFKDDRNNYKVELFINICKMLTINTIPTNKELTTFLNNFHIKNHKDLFVKICTMCNNKGIPDKNTLDIFFNNIKFRSEDSSKLNYSLVKNICSMCSYKGIPNKNKLDAFLSNPNFKNKDDTLNCSLITQICNMCYQQGIPNENQLDAFLSNPNFKNKDGTLNCSLITQICNMCYRKGIPDEEQLNIFLDDPKFKNEDGTLNYSLIAQICIMYRQKDMPSEEKIYTFLGNSRFKNKDGKLNYSLIFLICKMCARSGIPDEKRLNRFLDNTNFISKGTINYSLITNICTMCYRHGIPKEIELNAFLENYNFKINGTINYDLIACICSIYYEKGIPVVKELNDFLTAIFSCNFRTVKDNLIIIKLLVTLNYSKGMLKKTLITDFVSWITEKKQISQINYNLMRHLLCHRKTCNFPTKAELKKTEENISAILNAENIGLDTEFDLDDFNIKILSLYQIFKSDIINTLTEFIKIYPKDSGLLLDDFIEILSTNNFENLKKVLQLIKKTEFADKFNSLDYKNKIIRLLQIKNISYNLIKETITELPLEDMEEYALITLTSYFKNINRHEFACLKQCKNNLLQQNISQSIVDKYIKIITRFNQDDIEKYSKLENFKIITKNMSLKSLNSLIQNVSISESRQIFNEHINYNNSNVTEQTSITMFDTALMLKKCMEVTVAYNHEEFELSTTVENNTLIQLKNNNGEISNNVVLHAFLACIANSLHTEVEYTYDNKNKTLVMDDFKNKKSFVAPQLKITKTGVVITNWSLAQTNDFFNFVYAKDEDDVANNRSYCKATTVNKQSSFLCKRKRLEASEEMLPSKRQNESNIAKISFNVITTIIQQGMFIADSLWEHIYYYKDKLNSDCIQQLANKYKNNIPANNSSYFFKVIDFIENKIADDKLDMEIKASIQNIIDNELLNKELNSSINRLTNKEGKDRVFFEKITTQSLILKHTSVESTQLKAFAEEIINYLKASDSLVFNATEMQMLDILKEYKDFVSVEIIANNIVNRILIWDTNSLDEWNRIISEKSDIEHLLDKPYVDNLNLGEEDDEDEETLDDLLNQMQDAGNYTDDSSAKYKEETFAVKNNICFDDFIDFC